MTTLHSTSQQNRQAIATTVIAQLAVLLALSWALIVYLDWSSAAAMTEFMAAKPLAAAPAMSAYSSVAATGVHHTRAGCPRKA